MTNDEIAARAAQPTAEALGKWKGVPDRAVVRLLAAIRESFLDPDLRVEELRRSLGASNKLYTRFRRWIGISPRKTGVRRLASVSSQLAGLEKLGVIRIVRTGRQNVYLLGTWEDRSLAGDGSYVSEFFFLDQVFGPEPFEAPRLDDLPPGLSETSEAAPNRTSGRRPPRGGSGGGARANRTSGGALHRTSDVRCGDPLNKETNREGKRRRGAFEPVDDRERADDAIYVEY